MKIDADILKSVGITVSSCMAIVTGLWFFLQPTFERKVAEQIEQYTHTEKFQNRCEEVTKQYIDSADFKEWMDNYLNSNEEETDNVSLRKLLSIRIGVPPEQVAEELANMYNKDRKRLVNLLRAVNEQHPEYKVWSID